MSPAAAIGLALLFGGFLVALGMFLAVTNGIAYGRDGRWYDAAQGLIFAAMFLGLGSGVLTAVTWLMARSA